MVCTRAVHIPRTSAAPKVAAADNKPDLHTELCTFVYPFAGLLHGVKINAVPLLAGEHFPGQFQQYAFINRFHT